MADLCTCGHPASLHQADTGECWGFVIDADSQYCRCSVFQPSEDV